MADVDFKDMSGTPRSERDIEEALACISGEMIRNPMALSKAGGPLLLHYVVIRDVLREALALRISIRYLEKAKSELKEEAEHARRVAIARYLDEAEPKPNIAAAASEFLKGDLEGGEARLAEKEKKDG